MAFWDIAKKVARVGAGVATGGLSEAAIAGYNYATKGGGVGDKMFGGVKGVQPGDSSNYDYGGSPEYAQGLRDYLKERAGAASGRQAYQLDRSSVDNAMGQFNNRQGQFNAAMNDQTRAFRNEAQARGEQMNALGMYRDAAMGNAPSVAAAQQRQGLEESSRLGQNLAAGAIGANPLLAASNASAASADAARRSTSAAAQLRAQEIDAARAGYAGLSGAMRQGDLARGDAYLARGNAALGAGRAALDAGQFGFGAEQAQAGLDMQQRGMNDAQELAYQRFLLDMNRDALAGRMGYGNSQAQASGANANNSVARRGQNQQLFGDILDTAGKFAGGAGGG